MTEEDFDDKRRKNNFRHFLALRLLSLFYSRFVVIAFLGFRHLIHPSLSSFKHFTYFLTFIAEFVVKLPNFYNRFSPLKWIKTKKLYLSTMYVLYSGPRLSKRGCIK